MTPVEIPVCCVAPPTATSGPVAVALDCLCNPTTAPTTGPVAVGICCGECNPDPDAVCFQVILDIDVQQDLCPESDPMPAAYTLLNAQNIGPNRPASVGQIVALGGQFNIGNNTGPVVQGGIAGGGTTYSMQADGTIATGGIWRFGPDADVTISPGSSCELDAVQYTAIFDDNTGYSYQPGMNNTTIAASNDPLFFDGTRVQTSHLSTLYSLGDQIWQVTSLRAGSWLNAADNKLLWQWHAPDNLGVGLSVGLRPWLALYVDNGVFRLVSHTDTGNTPTNGSMTSTTHWAAPVGPYVNQKMDFIVDMTQLNNNNGSLTVWLRAGGGWSQIVTYQGPIGFDYSGYGVANANNTNYLAESYYQWHNGNPTDLNYPVRNTYWFDSRSWRNTPATFNDVAESLEYTTCCDNGGTP